MLAIIQQKILLTIRLFQRTFNHVKTIQAIIAKIYMSRVCGLVLVVA